MSQKHIRTSLTWCIVGIYVSPQKDMIGDGNDKLWTLDGGDGLSTLLSPQLLKAKCEMLNLDHHLR